MLKVMLIRRPSGHFDPRLVIALLIRCIRLSFCLLSMVPAIAKIISLRWCECRILEEEIRLLGG